MESLPSETLLCVGTWRIHQHPKVETQETLIAREKKADTVFFMRFIFCDVNRSCLKRLEFVEKLHDET